MAIKYHSNIRLMDNNILQIGTDGDLKLEHTGSNSNIYNTNGNLNFIQYADDKDIVFQSDDGSGGVETYFYLDGSHSSGNPYTHFPDNSHLVFGGSTDDLDIYHNGTNSYIQNTTGNLIINQRTNDGDLILQCDDGSGGETAYLTLDGSTTKVLIHKEVDLSSHLSLLDSAALNFGNANDLQIYHDGSNSYIQDVGTGDLRITTSGGGVKINKGVSESIAHFIPDGSVDLYYDNAKKFETTSAGATVTGKLTVAGSDNLVFLDSGGNSYLTIDRSATDRRSALVFSTAGDGTSAIPNNINWALGAADSDEVGDGTGFFIGTSTNATSSKLFIKSDGKVGVGVTSPNNALHVSGNLDMRGNTDTEFDTTQIFLNAYNGSSNNNSDTLGTGITWKPYYNSYSKRSAGILQIAEGNYFKSGLAFYTNGTSDATTDWSERMRISMDGKVGIGTTSPQQLLDISAVTGATLRLTSTGDGLGSDTSIGAIEFFGNDASAPGAGVKASITAQTGVSLGDDADLIFKTSTGAANNVEVMRIDGSTSNVGIGTTSPSFKLDVEGDIGMNGKLYHNGDHNTYIGFESDNIKLRTGGVDALELDSSQNATFAGHVNTVDNKAIYVGTSLDFGMYHDGTHTYLTNDSVAGSNLYIRNATNDADTIFQGDDGSGGLTAYLTLDGSVGHTTVQKEINFEDSIEATFGAANDLRIFHNGSHTYLSNQTGDLYIRNQADNKDIIFQSDDGSGSNATYFQLDGTNTRTKFSKNVNLQDSVDLYLGTSSDLRLVHNSADSVISNSTGDLYIINSADDKDIIFQSDDGSGGVETYFFLDGSSGGGAPFTQFPDGSVISMGTGQDLRIQHDGSNSYIETTTGNLYIKQGYDDGDIIFQSDDGSGGVATYFFLDGSSLTTKFQKDLRIVDNIALTIGNENDFILKHNATNSEIINNTGNLEIRNQQDDGDIIFKSDDGSGGTTAYLTLDGSATRIFVEQHMQFDDNKKVRLGSGADLELYHDGSNSYIKDTGTGSLFLQASDIFLKTNTSENAIACASNGAVTLYYDNAAKLATKSDGVDITGELQADSLDIDGNADISGGLGVAGAIYQTENGTTSGIGIFMPMVQGGLKVTSSEQTTGRLRIKVPAYKSNTMQTFFVDIYEYNTDRSATYRVSGYNYQNTNASWYNTSAVALFDSDNRDLTVRFGADTSASEQYVAIGEVNTTWDYVQVVVRDYLGGYNTSVSEATAAFEIEFVTTDNATYNVNHDNNQPMANWSKIESIPSNVTNALPTTGGTMSGAIAMGNQNITGAGTITAGTLTGTSLGINGNADISGTLDVGEMLTIDITDISTGENRGLQLLNSNGTDQQWNVTAGETGVDNDKFVIRDATYNINALTLAVNSGDATFAGDVTTSGNIYLNNNKTIFGKNTSGSNYGLLTITSGNVVKLGAYSYTSAATEIGLGDNGKFLIGTAEALSIDSSKNATFAGKVKINSVYTANTDTDDLQIGSTTTGNGGLSIITGNTNTGGIFFGDNDNNDAGRIKYIHSSNSLLFDTNRTNALTIDSSQNATFAGDITVAGDLNVTGDTITTNTTTITVKDPIIAMANNNAADVIDIGLYGKYVESATVKYTGMVRDASEDTNSWIFFDGLTAEPGTTVDTSNAGFDYADIRAGLIRSADGFIGNLTGNVTGNTSGTAATVTGAAQSSITSLGTLSALTVAGNVAITGGNLDFSDGRSANFGNADDLQIYHDGSHSYIIDDGTGDLRIKASNNINFYSASSSEVMAKMINDGGVELYHNAVKKFETTSAGVEITGELQADSLDIDGNADIAGTVSLDDTLTVNNATGTSQLFLTGTGNGYVNAAVVLQCNDDNGHSRGAGVYMNNVVGATEWFAGRPYSDGDSYKILRRHTTSGTHSNNTADPATTNTTALMDIDSAGNTVFAGNITTTGGDSVAPQINILHDGTNPGANEELGVVQFQVDYDGSHQDWGKIRLDTNASATRTNMEFYVKSTSGAEQVALTLEGQPSAVPNATFSGDITADKITTNTGSGSAILGSHLDLGDNQKVRFGASDDLQIYHDGTKSKINNDVGNLEITNFANDSDIIFSSDDGSGGVTAYLTLDGGFSVPYVALEDSAVLALGTHKDLLLTHDGTDSKIDNMNTGDIKIRNFADDKDIIFQSDDGSGGVTTYFTIDGSAELNRFAKNVMYNDNVANYFGGGFDLQIKHEGTNSLIDNITGDLYIRNYADDKDIIFQSDDGSGGVETYLTIDGSARTVNFSRHTFQPDGIVARFGTDNDLQIYHSGSSAYIHNETGDLYIENDATDKDIIFKSDDGSGGVTTYLRIDGGDEIMKAGKDLRFSDSVKATFGASDDLKIYHDGSNSALYNTTGHLYIMNGADDSDIIFQSDDGSGGTETYFYLNGGFSSPYTVFPDTSHLAFGNSFDLVIHHDTANSYITAGGTGDLILSQETDDKDIILRSDDGSGGTTAYLTLDGGLGYTTAQKNIRFGDGVRVVLGDNSDMQLHHTSGSNFLEISTGNLSIRNNADDGDIALSSDDGAGGLATYFYLDGSAATHDGSATTHLFTTWVDNSRIAVGTGRDFQINHDGTDTYLSNNTGDLIIQNNTDDKDIIFRSDDGSGGTTAYLTLDGSAGNIKVYKNMNFQDNDVIQIGTSGDLQIYHDGDDSFISNTLGHVVIQNDAGNKDIIFKADNGSGVETYFQLDGSATRTVFSKDALFSDNVNLAIGDSLDLYFVHTGTSSFITQQGAGDLYIRNITDDRDIIFQSDDGSGGVTEYFRLDGSAGYTVVSKDINFSDNTKALFGASHDLQIYHDGSNSYINDAGTGDLLLRRGGAGGLNITGTGVIINGEADINGVADISNKLTLSSANYNEHLAMRRGSYGYDTIITGTRIDFSPTSATDTFKFLANVETTGALTATSLDINGNADISGNVVVGGTITSEKLVTDVAAIEEDNVNNAALMTLTGQGAGTQNNIGLRLVGTTASDGTIKIKLNAMNNAGTPALTGAGLISYYGGGDTMGIGQSTTHNNMAILIDNNENVTLNGTLALAATKKLYFDGGTHTYLTESADNNLQIVTGGTITAQFAGTGLTLRNTQVNGTITVGANDTGHDVKFFGATSGRYLLWDESDDSLNLTDSTQLKIGASADLRLYHDGSDSYVRGYNHDLIIMQDTADKDIKFKADDGSGGTAEYFRLDGGGELTYFSKHLQMADNANIYAGSSGDLAIFHNATDSYILNSTGNLYIGNNADDKDVIFQSDDGSGGTTEYFRLDGSAATSAGITTTLFPDNSKLKLGAGGDFVLFHDGTDSIITNNTGDVYIKNTTNDKDILLQSDDGSGGNATYIQLDGSNVSVNILTQKVIMANLPTSDPAVDGQLWNSNGTLKVSAGE